MRRSTSLLTICAVFLAGYLFGQSATREAAAQAVADRKTTPEYTIDNCVSILDTSDVEESSAGWFTWFAPKDLTQGLVLKMSQVRAQQGSHDSHTHESEEILYVLDGKAEFTIKNRTKVVGENSSLYCPPGVPHRIRNVGDEPLRYLVIHAYE